jgi:hypothetical protein
MNKILHGYRRLNVYGQFLVTLAFLSIFSAIIGEAAPLEPSSHSFAINFGPLACVSAFVVLFFRVATAGDSK